MALQEFAVRAVPQVEAAAAAAFVFFAAAAHAFLSPVALSHYFEPAKPYIHKIGFVNITLRKSAVYIRAGAD